MSLLFNPVDVLQQLASDATMQTFLGDRGVALPDYLIDPEPQPIIAAQIAELIATAAPDCRDRIRADLRQVTALASATGQRLIYSICADTPEVLDRLSEKATPMQRSFWLFVAHRSIFEAAEEALWFEHAPRTFSKSYDVGVRLPVHRDAKSLRLFESAIAHFYSKKEGCGRFAKATITDHHADGSVLVTVYIQDHVQQQPEFNGDHLEWRSSTPARWSALQFWPAMGEAKTVVRHGRDYHEALIEIFALCFLRTKVHARQIRPILLNLQPLKQPLPLPADIEVSAVQLRELTLFDVHDGSELVMKAPTLQPNISVHDLDRRWCPKSPLLANHCFRVTAAKIAVIYPPAPSTKRFTPACRAVIELRKTGGTNLEEFEEGLRTRLGAYLNEWHITSSREEPLPGPLDADVRGRLQ